MNLKLASQEGELIYYSGKHAVVQTTVGLRLYKCSTDIVGNQYWEFMCSLTASDWNTRDVLLELINNPNNNKLKRI